MLEISSIGIDENLFVLFFFSKVPNLCCLIYTAFAKVKDFLADTVWRWEVELDEEDEEDELEEDEIDEDEEDEDEEFDYDMLDEDPWIVLLFLGWRDIRCVRCFV